MKKVAIISKLICKFSSILVKIPKMFLEEFVELSLIFQEKQRLK